MNVLFNVVFLILVTVFSTTKGLVTDKDYASLPDLFHQDNFDKCMLFGDEALYCNFEYELEPLNNENALWKTIQELSKDDCNYRHDNLRHWICVPTSCPNVTEKFEDGTTLTKQINNCYDNKMLKYGFKGTVKNLTCDTNKSKFPVNWIDILVGFLFIAYISFVLLCTIVDNVIQSCYEKDYEDFSNTSYGRMVISFSLYRSWIRLTTVKSTPEVDYFRPLQGVRFYNQIIVILSHTTLAGLVSSVANTKFVESMNSSIGSIFLSSGPMCVSTMFCLSSTFLSYGIFSHFEKRKLTLNVLVMLFVERYLRLIPPLAVVLLFNVTWWRHLGNGPNWNRIVGKEYLNCRKNMWTNLLFVNNLIDAENMCTPTTWSVALDTQYFILLLLLLWYIKKHEKYILHIVGSLLCTGILITFYINYINKLEAFTIPRAETVYDMKNLGGNPHWQKQFMSLSGNTCGPLLGVIFGYIIYKTRNVEMFKQKPTSTEEDTIDTTDQASTKGEVAIENESADDTAGTSVDISNSQSSISGDTIIISTQEIERVTEREPNSNSDSENSTFKTPTTSKRTKKRKGSTPEYIEKSINTLKSLKDDVQKNLVCDEFQHFANNIASQLRELPLADAIDCQIDLMQVLRERRLTVMRRNQLRNEASVLRERNIFDNTVSNNDRSNNIHHTSRPAIPESEPIAGPSSAYHETDSISHDSAMNEYDITDSANNVLNEAIESDSGSF
ncbi:nose resistant to fluoxetine protein 6-like isoform X3 [Diabrotica virgifera virgifera]|uniref:Acyltransferase 3 domain-containing protein n=1 Tax=Diabrotica virgifera virgifera TaxID=50390 RepID=A0ABM5L749_DIAVI|nr:nose resistant to fluoxetine protein 6-like isoform X1 [Diabrotica virgifera virgifera]XP_050518255.1 nose resistant to fluoxetine protein 6-like isoform X2 [Diabrotica virgifera virgifera]XP_050518256.1 nose resistant to fluoxetine protein 6-like isoform X3 [Diabrotica virgifera virgifera]